MAELALWSKIPFYGWLIGVQNCFWISFLNLTLGIRRGSQLSNVLLSVFIPLDMISYCFVFLHDLQPSFYVSEKNQNSEIINKYNVFTLVLSSTVDVFLQFFVVGIWFLRQVRLKTSIHWWNYLLRPLAGLCTILFEIKIYFCEWLIFPESWLVK